jgi:hypothetical protein
MLANSKKTGLVLGNLALRGDSLEIARRIAAKTNAALLSETVPSFSVARGEGRPIVEIIPYFLETGWEFLKDFEQLIIAGDGSPRMSSPGPQPNVPSHRDVGCWPAWRIKSATSAQRDKVDIVSASAEIQK